MTRKRVWIPIAAALTFLSPLLVGFGLDEGELKCEQAAVTLGRCCPNTPLDPRSCRQVNGCQRKTENTLVTMAESQCLQASSCEVLERADVCGRLSRRIELAGEGGSAPTLVELHAEDSLCTGL